MENFSDVRNPIDNTGKAKIAGSIVDGETGAQIPAKVQILESTGRFASPSGALLKVGPGAPFFYSDGTFDVEVPRGPTRVLVERGTEYIPKLVDLEMPSRGTVTVDLEMERWSDLGDQGWHPGNTHIHYDEKEDRPDDRIQLDPRVEDLRMTAISILRRWDLLYASNKYSPGMLTEFSSAHHHVQCGEENRHNADGSHEIGYGHVMFLGIQNVVEPVSRGLLVDRFDPDYPPLCYACDDAHRQGGIVIWCHNGRGMEAPVAAVLGKLDAFNLFDSEWGDPEYDIYYRMLNAGIKLPASTGSDWYISNANRVYAHTGMPFEYESWMQALKLGKTFITNGPALNLSLNGNGLGAEVVSSPGDVLSAVSTWVSHYPISRAEILLNGEIIAAENFCDGSTEGCLETDLSVDSDGWIAARLLSSVRDSYFQPVFAHTSPIYVKIGKASPESKIAARWFDQEIEKSLEWVRAKGKFYSDKQRREVVNIFLEGQKIYKLRSQ